jgi:heptaprenyl diphosphate synthase
MNNAAGAASNRATDTRMASSREKRRLWCAQHLNSADVFCAGLLVTGAFLLNPSTELRLIQFILFWFYSWLSGKKNNALITLFVIVGISGFNLITPYGRVLAEWGGFRLTHGALMGGLRKAFTLEGLLMLSKASIRPDLRLPGTFGSLLADCFRVLEQIVSRKSLITRAHIMEGIDALLMELSVPEEELEPTAQPARPRTVKASLLLLALTLPPLALTLCAYLV